MALAQEQIYRRQFVEESKNTLRRRKYALKALSRHNYITALATILIILSAGLTITLFYAQLTVAGYQLYEIENQLNDLHMETNSIYEEISQLTSLERIETIAVNELGMIKPDTGSAVPVKTNLTACNPPQIKNAVLPSASERKTGRPEGHSKVIEYIVGLVTNIQDKTRLSQEVGID